jgi:putative membrane protein
VATVFLVSIVFLVILKNALSMVWGLIGLLMFIIILLLAIRIYKKIRLAKTTLPDNKPV